MTKLFFYILLMLTISCSTFHKTVRKDKVTELKEETILTKRNGEEIKIQSFYTRSDSLFTYRSSLTKPSKKESYHFSDVKQIETNNTQLETVTTGVVLGFIVGFVATSSSNEGGLGKILIGIIGSGVGGMIGMGAGNSVIYKFPEK